MNARRSVLVSALAAQTAPAAPPDRCRIEGLRLVFEQVLQGGEPLPGDLVRHLTGQTCRRRAGRALYLKEGAGKPDAADKRQSLLEIGVGLAREPDNNVCG